MSRIKLRIKFLITTHCILYLQVLYNLYPSALNCTHQHLPQRKTGYATEFLGLIYDASWAVLNWKWDEVEFLLVKYVLLLVSQCCVGGTCLKFWVLIGCVKITVLYWSVFKGFGRVSHEFVYTCWSSPSIGHKKAPPFGTLPHIR